MDLRKIGLAIHELGAFKDKSRSEGGLGFKLKLHENTPDAPLSPVYLNLRTPDNPKPGTLTAEVIDAVAEQMFLMAIAQDIPYSHIAGVPNAGDPIAEAFVRIASENNKQVGRIRLGKTAQDDKRSVQGIVEGSFQPHDQVLILDDLITKADSKIEAATVLRGARRRPGVAS